MFPAQLYNWIEFYKTPVLLAPDHALSVRGEASLVSLNSRKQYRMNWLPLFIITGFPLSIQAAYLMLCPIVALIGRNKIMGFWGMLFFSLLFSPLLGLFIVLVSARKDRNK
uniref:Uncharacterized protein n=1 Tax=Candidatus Kentrum sp. LPFa TaxID=2126335 RepID=A0A450X6N0_9GAMM|nr:MAG: hypothetical protein BECKLPF1236A_GA0070988_1001913 [Candidatus Kentron sp. LPFa]VFK24957.1 MAG: hypothetical protein BECKLPF1236C_GA0070990_1001713 [Candidatus Kentron sp. LPFa]